MIIKLTLNYKGYHKRRFQFMADNGRQFNFRKSCRALIEDADLTGSTNINSQFLVSHFIDETQIMTSLF